MSTATLSSLVRRVRDRLGPHHDARDDQLLERWTGGSDESAFELLVWRHGPMVWQTCRRILRHDHDAEDAFQAAFLVLARKAGSIRTGGSLAGWLYRVASRAAVAARARRGPVALDALPEPAARPDAGELPALLDEELARLPAKYREPFILCYLEGRTTDEAAQALGCPRGTVATRLAWARQALRDRLRRHGCELPVALAPLGLPATLVSATVETMLTSLTTGASSGVAIALSEEVIRTMMTSKLKLGAACLTVLTILGSGTGFWLESRARADKPTAAKTDKPATPKTDKSALKGDKDASQADFKGLI